MKQDEDKFEKKLEALAKSNPEKLRSKEIINIHKTLIYIIEDVKIHDAIKKYSHPIEFAKDFDRCSPLGYTHLEYDPKSRLVICTSVLDFMADHFEDNHLEKYPIYILKNRTYFDDGDNGNKRTDAAKDLIDADITAEYILESLESAIDKIISKKKK